MHDHEKLVAYLTLYKHEFENNDTSLYLRILAFIFSEHKSDFTQIELIKGEDRIYFSKDRNEVESSGNQMKSRQIPGSDYWTFTNENSGRKETIIREALRNFGYSSETMNTASLYFSDIEKRRRFLNSLV